MAPPSSSRSLVSEGLIDSLIASQRLAIRYYLLFGGIVFLLGIAVMFLGANKSLVPNLSEKVLSLGGGFISTLSGFPLKEVLTRRDRMSGLQSMKTVLAQSHNPDERKRLSEIFWATFETMVTGK